MCTAATWCVFCREFNCLSTPIFSEKLDFIFRGQQLKPLRKKVVGEKYSYTRQFLIINFMKTPLPCSLMLVGRTAFPTEAYC